MREDGDEGQENLLLVGTKRVCMILEQRKLVVGNPALYSTVLLVLGTYSNRREWLAAFDLRYEYCNLI